MLWLFSHGYGRCCSLLHMWINLHSNLFHYRSYGANTPCYEGGYFMSWPSCFRGVLIFFSLLPDIVNWRLIANHRFLWHEGLFNPSEVLVHPGHRIASLRSKRSRTKSDQEKQLFRIRATWKMGRGRFSRPRSEARAKMWKKRSFNIFAVALLFARPECEKVLSRSAHTGTLATQATELPDPVNIFVSSHLKVYLCSSFHWILYIVLIQK